MIPFSKESWSEVYGNFKFIDCVPQAEILDIASTIAPTTGLTVDQVQENYNLAGGVARLCLQRPDVTSQLLEGALKYIDLQQCWWSLERLSDKDTVSSTTGEKLYPGLIAHICLTDPFRNQFTLQVCSPNIERRLAEKTKQLNEGELEALMNELISVPSKSRSFGRLIWEPLFSIKARKGTG
jgi:hypothetical protein